MELVCAERLSGKCIAPPLRLSPQRSAEIQEQAKSINRPPTVQFGIRRREGLNKGRSHARELSGEGKGLHSYEPPHEGASSVNKYPLKALGWAALLAATAVLAVRDSF